MVSIMHSTVSERGGGTKKRETATGPLVRQKVVVFFGYGFTRIREKNCCELATAYSPTPLPVQYHQRSQA